MTIAVFIVLWFLPVIVAVGRGVRVRTCISIALITTFLSWTLVGWVVALIWSIEVYRAR